MDDSRRDGDRTESVPPDPSIDRAPTEVVGTPSVGPPSAVVPDRIGRYRILGTLGEGGMGIVYEAEQESPRRRVAVKVVRGGHLLDELHVRMFQREVETLARLQHPNIGAIYESGRTEDGQHFFAMELVRGDTLDVYLATRGRAETVDEVRFRLALFRKITETVHYAHQRGVIHRDLKPSNIIVTDESGHEAASSDTTATWAGFRIPEIKILDFGLARITEGDIQATLTAEVGVIKGTLQYMSPEQARGDPEEIDLRADVYALGVILYEMLSGRRPYDLTRGALVEAVRAICEVPPTPLRQTMRGVRRLDADVETIIGKALEKEADRRYSSAAALAQDVARYLSSQPILARPPSAVYQLRKFAARNRVLVGGIAATFVALVAGIVVSTVFGLREAAERRQAERARQDLEEVVEFQSEMLSSVDPEGVGRRLMADLEHRVGEVRRNSGAPEAEAEEAAASFLETVEGVNATSAALRLIDEEILGRAAATIEERFGDQPLIEARLRATLGNTYSAMGLYRPAAVELQRALDLRREVLGDIAPETLASLDDMAILLRDEGRYDEALPIAEQALAARTRVLGEDHRDTLASANTLALVYTSLGRLEEAEKLYRDTLTAQRRVLGVEHPHTMSTMNNLGVLYDNQHRYAAAQEQLAATLDLRRRVLGSDAKPTLATMSNLAKAYAHAFRYADAGELFEEVLATQRRVLGDEHPVTLAVMNNLAIVYESQGRHADAESLHLHTLDLRRRVLGAEHPDTLISMTNLANVYAGWGRPADAEQIDREVLAIRHRVVGPEHPDTLVSMNNLAVLYLDLERYREAEPLLIEALETRIRVTGFAHRDTDRVRRNLIELYQAQGRVDDMRPLVSDMLETARLAAERDDALAVELNDYAWQLLTVEPVDLRDPARALDVAQRACAMEEASGGPELWNYLDTLALAWHSSGDTAQAAATERRALGILAGDRPERTGIERQLAEYEALISNGSGSGSTDARGPQ
jgi:tetratricopeptide (TPR) repeat protein/tRNA A-37 threonylcarbamoyl transferase component Bud32